MMTRMLTMLLLLGEVLSQTQEAGRDRRPQRRRCFTCRSRGDKGDCRDPFIAPETEENRRQSVDAAVEEVPCSTGWCSKVLEGLDKNFGDNDYGIATERQCMERAPSDNQERCDFVQLGLKKVYMCFCKGDLCNRGGRGPQGPGLLLGLGLASWLLVR